VWLSEAWAADWFRAKLVLVLILTSLHGLLARWCRHFAADRNRHSAKFYRLVNELPTVLMIGIVILAIVKPF
jgi:putative membrane protein